jgi:hypothetical protein
MPSEGWEGQRNGLEVRHTGYRTKGKDPERGRESEEEEGSAAGTGPAEQVIGRQRSESYQELLVGRPLGGPDAQGAWHHSRTGRGPDQSRQAVTLWPPPSVATRWRGSPDGDRGVEGMSRHPAHRPRAMIGWRAPGSPVSRIPIGHGMEKHLPLWRNVVRGHNWL